MIDEKGNIKIIKRPYHTQGDGRNHNRFDERNSNVSKLMVPGRTIDFRGFIECVRYALQPTQSDNHHKWKTQPNIGEILDEAVDILEDEYPRQLKDVVPKIYTSINLDALDLAYLVNLFSTIQFGLEHKARDIFGRIYEYFLGKFTEKEGKKGGEFFRRIWMQRPNRVSSF